MTDLENPIWYPMSSPGKAEKEGPLPSDEIKLMPVLQAKTSNWTVPLATKPDTSEEREEKIQKRKGKIKP